MIDSYFRNAFQKKVVEPTIHYSIFSAHPIFFTFFGLLLGCISSLCIFWQWKWMAVLLLVFSGFFDVLDGSIARKRNQVSNLGATLDLIFDRVVEFCILYALYKIEPETRGELTILMLGSIYLCVSSFFVVSMFVDQKSEKSFYYSPGMIERTEAFFFFTALILFPKYFTWIASIFTFLVFLTSVIRLAQFSIQEITHRHFLKEH